MNNRNYGILLEIFTDFSPFKGSSFISKKFSIFEFFLLEYAGKKISLLNFIFSKKNNKK